MMIGTKVDLRKRLPVKAPGFIDVRTEMKETEELVDDTSAVV